MSKLCERKTIYCYSTYRFPIMPQVALISVLKSTGASKIIPQGDGFYFYVKRFEAISAVLEETKEALHQKQPAEVE